MSADGLQLCENEIRTGIDALQQGRKAEAGIYFLNSLKHLDGLQETEPRRNMLSEISELFLNAGFEDLALMAVLEALEIDNQLGLERGTTKDKMTLANIQTRLENLEQAEANYRSLLETCLGHGDYANAASASTNLAGILANDKYLDEAAVLLDNSLEYLSNEAFPSTEINTRFMRIQVLELRRVDPQTIFSEVRTVLDRFGDELHDQFLSILAQFIDTTLERFSTNRPEFNAITWKQKTFPEIFGSSQ